MKKAIREHLQQELRARGYGPGGEAPHGTMWLADTYETALDLARLLEKLVARREKIFRAIDLVERESAERDYDDVHAAIEAVIATLARLEMLTEPG